MKFNWLINNLWTKLGALLLALALWFYVAGEGRVEVALKVPVQLELASGMVVTEQSANELKLLVRGRKELISKLTEKDLISKVDLTKYAEPETIVYPVERKNIPLNREIAVLKTIPVSLEIKVDKLTQKVLPVRVITKGEPAPAFKLRGFILDPISAIVKGPEGYLKDLKYIETESVDITGRRKSFKKMVPLQSIPMVGEEVPTQFVEVIVEIGPK